MSVDILALGTTSASGFISTVRALNSGLPKPYSLPLPSIMAFFKTWLTHASAVAQVVAVDDVAAVIPGEVFVANSEAGGDEILVLVLDKADDGVFKGSILHGAKKATVELIRKLGTTQLYVFAQSEEEVQDEEAVGLAIWNKIAEAEGQLVFGQLAWVTRTRKAQIVEKLDTLRAAMSVGNKV